MIVFFDVHGQELSVLSSQIFSGNKFPSLTMGGKQDLLKRVRAVDSPVRQALQTDDEVEARVLVRRNHVFLARFIKYHQDPVRVLGCLQPL